MLKIFKMKNEIWKDIIGYEGLYQISSLGRVKSLGNDKSKKEKILKNILNGSGYFQVGLYKNNKNIVKRVHQLVAIAFLNHKPCGHKLVVDHINDNQTDNRVDNLQIITQRENAYKTQGKYSSQYKGVCFDKYANKWTSKIYINGSLKHLGLFLNQQDAYQAYKNKIKEISVCI